VRRGDEHAAALRLLGAEVVVADLTRSRRLGEISYTAVVPQIGATVARRSSLRVGKHQLPFAGIHDEDRE
jgi:hypothetical protein